MKKYVKVRIVLLMMVLFINSSISIQAAGEEPAFVEVPLEEIVVKSRSSNSISTYSENSLASCDLGIGINKNGIGITYTTRATTEATEIGCKDMVLQEKTFLGWKDIPIKDQCTYDSDYYMGSVVYLKAEANKTYRVYCTHYAIIDGEEYTLYNITDSIVFN